jgi:hypothetical protein
LQLQLYVAKELGMTLAELTDKVTLEELSLWAAFFEIEAEEQKKAAKRR